MPLPQSRLLLALAAAAAAASALVGSASADGVGVGSVGVGEPECRPTALDEYDYVVVGAGTAGSVAASHLASSLPSSSVLLIDIGRDRSDSEDVMNNDRFVDLIQSPNCEHHFTREDGMGGMGPNSAKKVYLCVSKILGGASSINFGGWYRAPQSDLDEWSSIAKSDQWTYDAMLPYFKKIERLHRPGETEKSDDRGYDGVVPVLHQNISMIHVHTGMLSSIERHLGVAVGDQDNNGRDQEGINTLQVSRIQGGCWTDEAGQEIGCADWMRNGSAYNAFIRDPIRRGELSNLEVLQAAKVVKLSGIAPEDDGDIVIEYVKKGYRYVVRAANEVLLSAGSWGNPKIAMLSGIGDATHLAEVGVTPVVDSPGVGRHLMDHGVLWLTAMLNNVQAMDPNATGVDFDESAFRGKDNPLPALMADFNAINLFFKSDDSLEYPDMELLAGANPAGPNRALLLLRVYQNRGTSGQDEDPSSGGSLRLRSDDPGEEMDATRNWYADDESVAPMRDALKRVIAMVNDMSASAPMLLEPNAFAVDLDDDDALTDYIRGNAVSEMHLMGSMRMGADEGDDLAVVDSELRVRGTNGRLRVADTSVFPTGLRGHPMAAAMAVGARAADFIVEAAPEEDDGDGGGGGTGGGGDNGASTMSGGSSAGGDCMFAAAAAATATTCAFAIAG